MGIAGRTCVDSIDVEVKKEDFITQDEIDPMLGKGKRAFHIYDYFAEGHNSKEAVNFLKAEYGKGGGSNALAGTDQSWSDYSFKGIVLKKGNILEPITEVILSWKTVEKHIRKLIQELPV